MIYEGRLSKRSCIEIELEDDEGEELEEIEEQGEAEIDDIHSELINIDDSENIEGLNISEDG